MDLQAQFGHIDVYLFDQLLRGRIRPGMRVLDAGCGGGRNLVYLLREGFDVHAVDEDPQAIAYVREMAAALAPALPPQQIRLDAVESMSFPDRWFDVVISNAVLHFSRDDGQFEAMVQEMWRVLKPGGMLFARLASSIGMTLPMEPLGGRRYVLPDGSTKVRRRRGAADGDHSHARRRAARSAQDDGGSASALHDYVGRRSSYLTATASCLTTLPVCELSRVVESPR